ncbi:unnamed protein product [Hermetia illucens]|uniref:RRM domain-containing protein n=1 Tax=Hermetia illucens TaxID=343691 RepID=A0A7R8UQG6_HERIL|nr:uncharacterized protein LOC119652563 [Hermetia illucens]CAD7084173.1 unnamed protein product [Hermetia illucens]
MENLNKLIGVVVPNPVGMVRKSLSQKIGQVEEEIHINRNRLKKLRIRLRSELKKSRPASGVPLSVDKDLQKRSVLVYNINRDASRCDLVMHFKYCGWIESTVMFEEGTEFCGMACITFKHEVSAYIALSMNKSLFQGVQIRVLPWGLEQDLLIIRAIVKAWGKLLAIQFPAASRIKYCLRKINGLCNYHHKLSNYYLELEKFRTDSNSEEARLLFRRCFDAVHFDEPRMYPDCDEKLIGVQFHIIN